MIEGIGHNSRRMTLAEAAEANVQTGVLLLCKEALVTAIQDRRLERGHLRVLAAMASFMNTSRARAWPGRDQIAAMTGVCAKTVSNILLELKNFGYLIAEKEPVPEAGDKRLTVYTFGNVDHETIRKAVADLAMNLREQVSPSKSPPAGNAHVPAHGEHPRPRGTKMSPPAGSSTQEVPARGVKKSPPAGDSNSKKELSECEGGNELTPTPPHTQFDDADVIISVEHGKRIRGGVVARWRQRFPHLADLDARVERFCALIEQDGQRHRGWANPEGWMTGLLAQDDQRAANEARVTESRIAATKGDRAHRVSPDTVRFAKPAEEGV